MAIARGAGTEIIRTVHVDDLDSAGRIFIFGEQHHIYTVLSVIVFPFAIQAAGNWCSMTMQAKDALGGTTNADIGIFKQEMQLNQTFVWNDKFSFNGHEPNSSYAGPMDTVAKQNLIVDQDSSTSQKLYLATQNAADNFHVHITYIDQNNS